MVRPSKMLLEYTRKFGEHDAQNSYLVRINSGMGLAMAGLTKIAFKRSITPSKPFKGINRASGITCNPHTIKNLVSAFDVNTREEINREYFKMPKSRHLRPFQIRYFNSHSYREENYMERCRIVRFHCHIQNIIRLYIAFRETLCWNN